MSTKTPAIDRVRQYLREQGYYRYSSKAATKKVFREVLAPYLQGEIQADFLSMLADEMLYTTLLKKGDIDLALLTALTRASSLESTWLASKLSVLNQQLKFYFDNAAPPTKFTG